MTKMVNYRIWLDRLGVSSDMGTFKVLLVLLLALNIVDALISYSAIMWLGATEGNPLFYMIGGLLPGSIASLTYVATVFMITKVIGGAVLIGAGWLVIHKPKPRGLDLLCFVCLFYGFAIIMNLICLIGGI